MTAGGERMVRGSGFVPPVPTCRISQLNSSRGPVDFFIFSFCPFTDWDGGGRRQVALRRFGTAVWAFRVIGLVPSRGDKWTDWVCRPSLECEPRRPTRWAPSRSARLLSSPMALAELVHRASSISFPFLFPFRPVASRPDLT